VTEHLATVGSSVLAGLVPGWLLAGPTGGMVGGFIGAVIGIVADRFKVRTVIAASVTAGAVTGAFIGSSIVAVLCRPGTCIGLEVLAAVLTGFGAFVGVGIIVALAARSFDEYRESR
jgi:MFS family permease